MSEQVGSVTHKKSSDFHGDDSLKYRIMAIKTNENFIPFSNNVTFRKPRGTDLVTASELIPGFCRSKSNVPTPGSLRTIKSPTAGIVPGIKSPPLARTPLPPTGFPLIGALYHNTYMAHNNGEFVNKQYQCCGSILSLV